MTDPTAPLPDEELAAIEARHKPFEHTDYVSIPPLTFTACESCEIGDGYEAWPCEASIVLAALRAERAARARVEAAAWAAAKVICNEFDADYFDDPHPCAAADLRAALAAKDAER